MTQIESIEREIELEKRKLSDLTRGCVVMPPGASKILNRIAQLNEKRDSIIANQGQSLGANLPNDEAQRNEIYRLMVKLPIVADFLYACCVELQGVMKRHNMQELTLSTKVKTIRDHAKDMAFLLSKFAPLEEILSNDDTLIDALDRKVNSFLDCNLKIV